MNLGPGRSRNVGKTSRKSSALITCIGGELYSTNQNTGLIGYQAEKAETA